MYGNITDVPGIKVGHVSDLTALTGCTVVLAGDGMIGGVDVRGAAPGTRETDLLRPMHLVERVHAIVLAGGSAFGLDAATGVMQYLEERQVGFDAGLTRVPIVPAAVLFDLAAGDYRVRPDRAMGYKACQMAVAGSLPEGNAGAGTGATVGKFFGTDGWMKGGLGSTSIGLASGLVVGAIVAVNAFGDVVDGSTGKILAGARRPETMELPGTTELLKAAGVRGGFAAANTTLAVVATNAQLTKEGTNKVAQMAHNGLARSIRPVHTQFDGDVVFALAGGEVSADVTTVGALAAEALEGAVLRAIKAADGLPGIPSARDLGCA